MIATDVTGLVIDAMLKMALVGKPAEPSNSTPLRSTTISATAGASPFATASFICAVSAALATAENPATATGAGAWADSDATAAIAHANPTNLVCLIDASRLSVDLEPLVLERGILEVAVVVADV